MDDINSQSSTSLPSAFEALSSIVTSPVSIHSHGRTWIRTDNVVKRATGQGVSKVWDFGQFYVATNESQDQGWLCGSCEMINLVPLGKDNQTTNPLRHLRTVHSILASESTRRKPLKQFERNEEGKQQHSVVQSLNIDRFRKLLLCFIVKNHLPLLTVDDEDFRALLITLNPMIERHLFKRSQLREEIEKEFVRSKLLVKQLLANTLSRIHISFDLWSSSNGFAILGVMAHFVNSACQIQHVLVGLERMEYSHTGEDIAEKLIPLLQTWEVADRLGVFISDNADVNDVAIRVTLRELRPDIQDYRSRRSRCLGHIINLVAQAFIFGDDLEAFEAIITAVTESVSMDSKVMKDAQLAWRRKGPIGKLHNLIVFIRRLPQRREAFMRVRVGDALIDSK
jgi:hypothetical protein